MLSKEEFAFKKKVYFKDILTIFQIGPQEWVISTG